ncbi:exocyst subunit [Dipsacomyces acuminosporus]|nr:exocyst subunit [Dipsacomyces acuminosporus]
MQQQHSHQQMGSEEERKEHALRQAEDVIWQLPLSLEGLKRQDFNPVALALQMMDTSSLGKSHEEFQYNYAQLNDSLDSIVNEYYGGFNDSILSFSGLHDKIQGASGTVNHVKSNLYKVRRMILEERGSLDQLYTKSNQLGAIVSILNRIEEVKKLPEELAGYVREKKFLTAASKLVQDKQFVLDPELNPIEALSGLRLQLEKERSELLRLIIDELHNHIYLKSPYCERKMGVEGDSGEDADGSSGDGSTSGGTGPKAAGKSGDQKDSRKHKGARKTKKLDDSEEGNAEADSFAYVEMLLESLVTLENTSEAMQEIKSSISLELSRLIDGIISEVEERNKTLIVKSKVVDQKDDGLAQDTDREILFDFARILFARLETVLEYHDFVLEVVHSLDRRERYSIPSAGNISNNMRRTRLYSINDVWSAMKTEILALLKDYLIPEDKRAAIGSIDITRSSSMKSGVKDLFHMENNPEIADAVEALYSQIESRFQDMTMSMPSKKKDISSTTIVDEYSDQQNSLQHKMLVEASIEHAPTLLNMALSFTKRVSPLLASVSSASVAPSVRRSMIGDINVLSGQSPAASAGSKESDLDEYLQVFFKKIFLPRAETHAMQLFDAVTSASDAFQIDPNTYFNGRPIFRSAAALVPLLQSFGRLLNNLNLFRGENWGILLQMSTKYYERCWGLFRDLVRSPDNQTYTSVKWADTPDLLQLFDRKLKQAGSSQTSSDQGVDTEKEIRLEEQLKTERSLHLSELIFDVKRLVSLAQLHQTLEWLLLQLNRVASERAKVLGKHDGPITAALLKRHDADRAKAADRYHSLSVQCLMALRVEVRAHCTYYLDLATREGDYFLDGDTPEPDQYIQALNADISTIEEKMETCLPTDKLNLVFGGISILMSHILIANTRYIKLINDAGDRKMIRNILALQQNLTNIALPEESGLDKARKFYELYALGADGILKHVAENGALFAFESYRRLIEFIYSSDGQAGNNFGSGRASSLMEVRLHEQYEEHVRRLRELLSQAEAPAPSKAPPQPQLPTSPAAGSNPRPVIFKA